MRVAIQIFSKDIHQAKAYRQYVQQLFPQLVALYPAHDFLKVEDRRDPALRANRPDIWVRSYDQCQLRSKIPQILVVGALPLPHNRLRKLMITLRFRKAKRVVVFSEWVSTRLQETYSLPAEKISILPGAPAAIFQPLTWQEKTSAKTEYSGGREYFLAAGGAYNYQRLITLLKAFSLFKKWQHSNMRFVITHMGAKQRSRFLEKLATYKYREDILLNNNPSPETQTRLMASAYVLVHTASPAASGMTLLEALQAEIPAIAANDTDLAETGGDAVVYVHPDDPDAIGRQMLSLYRDENLRGSYIEKGKARAAGFSWTDIAGRFWQEAVL